MRPNVFQAVLSLLACFSPFLAAAAEPTVLVDFEDQARGELLADQFMAEGLRINASNWSDGPHAAVVFDTENIGLSEDNDLAAPFDPATGFAESGDLSPGKVMILHERNDCSGGICAEPDDESSRPAGWLELEFAVAATLHGFKLIDVNYETGEAPAQLVLFDANGEVLDSLDVPGVEGQGNWRPWAIERSGVQRARLYLPGDGAIDDISFTPEQAVNWTPEFESQPPVAVSPNGTYRYSPEVTDPDGGTVSLSLDTAPAGMVLSPAGEISWSPAGLTGSFPVVITATDADGTSAEQAFLIVADDAFLRIQDFEFPPGTILDSELLPDGLEIHAVNLSKGPDVAVVFDTDEPTGGDTDLGAPFQEGSDNDLGLGERSPGKVLVLHERHDCDFEGLTCAEPDDESSNPAGWIEFRFSQPAHVWSVDVFDVTSDDPAARQIELFDADNQPMAISLTVPRTGSNDWDRLLIDIAGVMRMRINLDGETAFDNLRYALVGSAQPDNQAPVANDDEFTTEREETLSVAAPGILANDHDLDGDSISAVLDDEPSYGTVVLNADGSFVYTPDAGFVGVDEFEYRVSDGEAASLPEDVEIHVAAPPASATIDYFTVNPASIAMGGSATLAWSVAQAGSVTINPGIGTVPATGNLAVSPAQSTTYTLTATGTDNITVTATRQLAVVPPTVFMEFLLPQAGSFRMGPKPEVLIEFQSPDGLFSLSTFVLTYNGAEIGKACIFFGNDQLYCRPTVELPDGPATFTAFLRDNGAIYSNVTEVSFTIDTVPPRAPDPALITVSEPDVQGQVTITGLANALEPGTTGRIRFPDSSFHHLPFSADGSFSSTFTAAGGSTFEIFSIDATELTSSYVQMQVPHGPPVIAIDAPSDGDFINTNTPEIVIAYMESGNGVDHTTLLINADNQPLAASCVHTVAESRCTPSNPLIDGQHAVTAAISDITGRQSNEASTVFTVDTVPPPAVVRDKLILEQEPEGTVTITGEAGAAEAGATVLVSSGDSEYSAIIGTTGEFTMEVSAGTGDQLSIYQSDVAGNAGAAEVFEVQATPVAVTISSPVAGSSVSGLITVRGHHNGPANTGVVINGMPAIVDEQGNFLISNLPMSEGAHDIAAIAKAPGRSPGNATISVTSDGSRPQLKLAPAATEGLSPVPAAFHVEYGGTSEILQVEVDIDGDGSMDTVFNGPLPEFTYTYTTPGIFAPKVRLHTGDGIHEATASVLVMDAAALEARIRQQWSDFSAALAAGDTETALSGMTRQAANRYRVLFETLGTQLAAGVSEYSQPELGHLDAGGGELLVSRPYEGETLWYVITFVRDVDGVWRIESL